MVHIVLEMLKKGYDIHFYINDDIVRIHVQYNGAGVIVDADRRAFLCNRYSTLLMQELSKAFDDIIKRRPQ